ncbi:MAG: alpha/beta fold hydrolase [Rhodospirillaceae bacterium]
MLGRNPVVKVGRLLMETAGSALRAEPPSPTDASPLLCMRAEGKRVPFFCVHALLGSAFHFHALSQLLDPDQPFYALQAPGLDGVEGTVNRIEDFAAFYLRHIREICPAGPYRLGGYSFGGLVAFEIARQLAQAGQEVSHLVIFGTDTPIATSNPKAFQALSFAGAFCRDFHKNMVMPFFSYDRRMGAFDRGPAGRRAERQSPQTGSFLWQDNEEAVAGTNAPLMGLSPAMIRLFGAHCLSAARYNPRPYPGQIFLLETLEQQILNPLDAARGWDRLAAGGVKTAVVSGNHLSMLDEPHIRNLAQTLDRILAEP